MTDTPEAGWLPDPDGGDFNRWFDGKHFTKRVQGEPPKAEPKKTPAPIPEPLEMPDPIYDPHEDENPEIRDSTVHEHTAWPILSTTAAVLSGLGLVGAFLLPLGRLPLVIAALGVAASIVALALAVVNDQRRIVAVWGIGIGLVGVTVAVTISMLG